MRENNKDALTGNVLELSSKYNDVCVTTVAAGIIVDSGTSDVLVRFTARSSTLQIATHDDELLLENTDALRRNLLFAVTFVTEVIVLTMSTMGDVPTSVNRST